MIGPLSRRSRRVVAVVGFVVGVPAVLGGYGLIVDADGLGLDRSWLEGSPFRSYLVPGLVLLVVVGGGMLATGALAVANSRYAGAAAVAMAAILLAWGVVETATIGYRGPPQLVLLAVFVVGPALILVLYSNRERREHR